MRPPLLRAPSAPLPTADSGLCVSLTGEAGAAAPRPPGGGYLLHWLSTTALVMTQ